MSEEGLSKDDSRLVTDEQFNTHSHLAAAVFALLGSVLLIVEASVLGDPWKIVSFSIYGFSLFFLFSCSALHHGVNGSQRINHVFRMMDYCAIFLLIAGSVTPLCLVLMRTPTGWSVFGVTWAVALAGIVVKNIWPETPKGVTLTLYIALGWVPVVLAMDLLRALPISGLLLMVAGGIIYSLGGLVFILERPNPVPGKFGFHELWHVFVITAAATHYAFMYRYVLPF